MSKRRLVAIVEIDDDVAEKNCEVNGLGDYAPVDYIERELWRLERSGITLEYCLIADNDDELKWARYTSYLITWAMDHSEECFEGCCPACFDEWIMNEGDD